MLVPKVGENIIRVYVIVDTVVTKR